MSLSLDDGRPVVRGVLTLTQPAQIFEFTGVTARPVLSLNRGFSAPVKVTSNVSPDRKSTRLNSSHSQISYAVFCLKKKHEHTQAPNPNDRRNRRPDQGPSRRQERTTHGKRRRGRRTRPDN